MRMRRDDRHVFRTGRVCSQTHSRRGSLCAGSTVNVKVARPPSAERLDVVYTKHYTIDSPLWNARAKAIIVNGFRTALITSTDQSHARAGGIGQFRRGSQSLRGEPHARQKGYVFANAWVHQTVESMCLALMVDSRGDPEIIKAQQPMHATLEDWIPKILAAQDRTAICKRPIRLRIATAGQNAGRPTIAAIMRDMSPVISLNRPLIITRSRKEKTNGFTTLRKNWPIAGSRISARAKRNGSMDIRRWNKPSFRFGRFVNDMEGNGRGDSYVKLAKFLLDCRRNGSEYDQSQVPVQQQYEAAVMPCAPCTATPEWRTSRPRRATPITTARCSRSGTTWSIKNIM